MKRYILPAILTVLAIFAWSCTRETATPYENESLPMVSLSSEDLVFTDHEATLVFTLSHFIHKDVVVTFETGGVDPEAIVLPSSFAIPAGKVKQTLKVSIDETVPAPGFYAVGISLASAENATVSTERSVAFGETVNDIARVTLEGSDVTDGEGILRVNLHKRLTEDAHLSLKVVSSGKNRYPLIASSAVSFDTEVTVPAGETSVTVPVTVNTTGLKYGLNQARIEVASHSGNISKGQPVAFLNCRRTIELTRNSAWAVSYEDGKVSATASSFNGAAYVGAFILDVPTASQAYLEEEIYQWATALSGAKDVIAASGSWTSPKVLLEATPEGGNHIAVMVGLDANLSPTGDYAIKAFYIEIVDTLELKEMSEWSFIYYSNYYYVYAPLNTKIGFWTVPTTYDVSKPAIIKAILRTYEAALKANASFPLQFLSTYSSKAYSVFELSAAGYAPLAYYTISDDDDPEDGTYYAFMIGITEVGELTGEYKYIKITY